MVSCQSRPQGRQQKPPKTREWESWKKFEKTWKKLLTKGKGCAKIQIRRDKFARCVPCKLNNVTNTKHQKDLVVSKALKKACENNRQLFLWSYDFSFNNLIRATKVVLIPFYWEFDPGSGWTLAACLTHASRTELVGKRLRSIELKLSGGLVSNAWGTCLSEGDNSWKRLLIPHDVSGRHLPDTKDLSLWDGLMSD